MKHVKRIISFLTIICCLAGSVMPAFASETGDSGSSTGDRIVFTNEQEKLPYLYVSKKVTSQSAVQAPEDDVFTFTLEKRGASGAWEAVEGQQYRVYLDTDTSCADPIPDPDSFVGSKDRYTKDGGRFTLKDGQKARFKLEDGQSYQVSEEEKNYYTRNPQSRTVDMQLRAEKMVFENLYKIDTGNNDSRLLVEKKIKFPAGYTAPETPEFTFRLEIKRRLEFEAYGEQPFHVTKRTISGSTEEYDAVTESDGTFRLRADCTALFDLSELPENARYRLTELHPAEAENTMAGAAQAGEDWEIWWPVQEEEKREGPVSAGKTETFTNSNVSFSVRKEPAAAAKSNPDAEFTFLLTDGEKKWTDVPYYLYDEAGNRIVGQAPVGSASGGTGIYKTDKDGCFKLKFGQTAVFLGISPGTAYSVSELVCDGYQQTRPLKDGLPDGYRREVQEEPESLTFTNEALPDAGLVVAKELFNADGEMPRIDEAKPLRFKFILWELNETSNQYERVANAGYSVGATKKETLADGGFELDYNQQALFETLPAGKTYRVTEVLDEDALLEYGFKQLGVKSGETEQVTVNTSTEGFYTGTTGDSQGEEAYQEFYGWQTVLPKDQRVSFLFTNDYKPNRMDLELTKIGADETKTLSGAIFTLYRNADQTDPVKKTLPDGLETSEYVTDADGKLIFENLKPGSYWLKEIKAPSGYSLLGDPIGINISTGMEKNQKKITVTIDSKEYIATDEQEVMTGSEIVPGVHAVVNSTKNDLVKIKVRNTDLYELPSSGGIGIYWYLISGTLLMMAAALILYKYQRQGRC